MEPGASGWLAEVPRPKPTLAGEAVGLVEVKEELWQIQSCDYKIAVLNDAQGNFWRVGVAAHRRAVIQAALESARVSPISSI